MTWYSIQHCSDWDWTNINKLTDHYFHQSIYNRHPISNPYGKTVGCLFSDSKVHGANMGPTWVLWAPDGHHVGPMNLAIRVLRIWETIDHIIRTLHCFRCTLWTGVAHLLFTVAIGCLANVNDGTQVDHKCAVHIIQGAMDYTETVQRWALLSQFWPCHYWISYTYLTLFAAVQWIRDSQLVLLQEGKFPKWRN